VLFQFHQEQHENRPDPDRHGKLRQSGVPQHTSSGQDIRRRHPDESSEHSKSKSFSSSCLFVLPSIYPGDSCDRFSIFKSKGGFAALDIGAHGELTTISVYDAPFRERSCLLVVKGPKIRGGAQLALSPDGSKLAILDEETVSVFVLPLKRPPGQN
jgi:hypothetical protein